MLINTLSGLNVALAFCMGEDLVSIISNPIGQPLATVLDPTRLCVFFYSLRTSQILFNSFGKKGTLAVWSFTIMVQ